jgi:hypothetical protein
MNQLTIKGVTVEIIKENWILTTFEANCLLNSTILEDLRIIYTDLHGDEDLSNLRLLQIFEGSIEVSRDIGERYLTNRIRPKTGEAMVASNAVAREYLMGASVIMGKNHPVQVFENQEEAQKWLESL